MNNEIKYIANWGAKYSKLP